MSKQILIIDDIHTGIFDGLEALGYTINYQPKITRDEILSIIQDYDGIVVRSKTYLDKSFFKEAKKLKFIARAGAGLDLIDLEEVNRREITVVNAPEGNRDALAEHCLGLVLCLLNKINLGHDQIKAGVWNREGNRGRELGELTVGIIGYGFMGAAFCQRLQSFGCKILVYDKYKTGFSNQWVQEATLADLHESCDVLSLHIPLSEETHGMVCSSFIEKFKKNIYVINTARGEILPLKDLKVQLSTGKVIAAALDVHEFEKKKNLSKEEQNLFDSIKTTDNVLLTPHVGGWTVASYRKISEVLLAKIARI